jgi:hypothetical protein
MIEADARRTRDLLLRKIRELEAPEREAKKIARAKSRKARSAAVKETSQGQRKERQHDKTYLAYTRRQPCILAFAGDCNGAVEATHLRFSDAKYGRINPGMGNKPSDKWVLPACHAHHVAQHAAGDERKWWSGWGIDPSAECLARHAAYLKGSA